MSTKSVVNCTIFISALVFMSSCDSKKSQAFTKEAEKPYSYLSYEDDGLVFKASTKVSTFATRRAMYITQRMLSNLPTVRQRMASVSFKIAILAQDQVLTDFPEYNNLKGKKTFDGRSYDETRGVASASICSIGEENLLCLPK